jgi:acylphosphatase
MMREIQARIYGRVQGVSFRYYTRLEAQRLGLTGWAKNEADGTVSVTAVGAEDSLKQFEVFLHRGSPAARVDQVDVSWSETDQTYKQFEIGW